MYLYDVLLDGEMIVEGSSDPECDLARALLARGVTGVVTVFDGVSGRPRTFVNIEKAAKVMVREDRGKGPCFTKSEQCVRVARVRTTRPKTTRQGSPWPREAK